MQSKEDDHRESVHTGAIERIVGEAEQAARALAAASTRPEGMVVRQYSIGRKSSGIATAKPQVKVTAERAPKQMAAAPATNGPGELAVQEIHPKMPVSLSWQTLREHRQWLGEDQDVYWARFGVVQSAGSRYERKPSTVPRAMRMLLIAVGSGMLSPSQLEDLVSLTQEQEPKGDEES